MKPITGKEMKHQPQWVLDLCAPYGPFFVRRARFPIGQFLEPDYSILTAVLRPLVPKTWRMEAKDLTKQHSGPEATHGAGEGPADQDLIQRTYDHWRAGRYAP